MDRNAHYLIVGTFITLVLIAATTMLIWMAGSYDAVAYERYTIYFEESVSGLSEGSKVSYRGVNIGKVLFIRFDRDNPSQIKVIVEVEENVPISTSSKVSLQSVGITGLSALTIKTEDANGLPLSIVRGEKNPIIPSVRSSLDQLFVDAPQITNTTIEILGRINRFLNDKNLENIEKTLHNINILSTNIALIANEDNVENMKGVLKNIYKTTSRFDAMLSRNQKQIERFTGKSLSEMEALVKETREMVGAYKNLAQRISNNPSQILYKPHYEGVKVEK